MAKKNNMAKFKTLQEAQEAFDAQSEELGKVSAENKQLKADLDEKDEIIASIRGAKTAASKPNFTLNKKTYEVDVKSTSWNKTVITAEEICADKNLQAELIEAGVGFITEVGS